MTSAMSNNGARSGITRALKFTPDIKFVNDETLNEFIVTVERRDVGEIDVKNDRDSDREDRDNPVRVNGQVSLISDWYELFDVREGQKLYVAPEKRFYIW